VNALFAWLDVDRVQWRALVRASLKVDFAAVRGGQNMGRQGKVVLGLWTTLLIYALTGFTPASVAAYSSDVLVGATAMTTIVGFMVMSTLLLGEGATITSPNDHHILGFRPITSRTYLAVRVATIGLRTVVITTCVAIAPVGVLLLKGGGLHIVRALAALFAAYLTGFAVTFGLIALYGTLLRVAGPSRLMRWSSYVQLAAQTITWFGMFAVTQDLGRRAVAGLSISGTVWALVYPGAWYGAWVALADGQFSVMTLAAIALSLSLLGALAFAIAGKLSFGYTESLGRLATSAAPRVAHESAARWLRILAYETRAVAILLRAHLKHDMRFRLGLISLIPITVMYMFMNGRPADPFVAGTKAGSDAIVIQMALFFLPLTVRRVLVTSESYRASWIFVATPADQATLVLSSRNIITLFFLVPYLLFMGALFAWAFGSVSHALLHTVFTGALSYLVLQFMVMMSPQLPFSMPNDKDTNAGMTFGLMITAGVLGVILYMVLRKVVYKSDMAMIVAGAVLLALAWIMDRVTRRRARKATIVW